MGKVMLKGNMVRKPVQVVPVVHQVVARRKIVLTAHVIKQRQFRERGYAQVKMVSSVTVRINGQEAIAFKQLGGEWNEAQALGEFRRSPSSWEVQPGTTKQQMLWYAELAD